MGHRTCAEFRANQFAVRMCRRGGWGLLGASIRFRRARPRGLSVCTHSGAAQNERLAQRRSEIIELIQRGFSRKESATVLNLREQTVRVYRSWLKTDETNAKTIWLAGVSVSVIRRQPASLTEEAARRGILCGQLVAELWLGRHDRGRIAAVGPAVGGALDRSRAAVGRSTTPALFWPRPGGFRGFRRTCGPRVWGHGRRAPPCRTGILPNRAASAMSTR